MLSKSDSPIMEYYFEQFVGDTIAVGYFVTQGDTVCINKQCPKCGSQQARRGFYYDGGSAGVEYWQCQNCGQIHTTKAQS
jgi:hypothetical protein